MKRIIWIVLCIGLCSHVALAECTVSLEGNTRIVQFEYQAEQTKVDAVLEDAARWMYTHKQQFQVIENETVVPFDLLSVPEKLSVLDQAVRAIVLQWARSLHRNAAVSSAVSVAESEAEIRYDLGE